MSSWAQIVRDKDRQIAALERRLTLNTTTDDIFAAIQRKDDRIHELETRQAELLKTIKRLANETPFPDEVKGWQEQRAKLTAEVGSLRAALMDARHQLLNWRTPGGPQNLDRLLVANVLSGIEQALEYRP